MSARDEGAATPADDVKTIGTLVWDGPLWVLRAVVYLVVGVVIGVPALFSLAIMAVEWCQ